MCLRTARELQKQHQTALRTPQTEPQPEECPSGGGHPRESFLRGETLLPTVFHGPRPLCIGEAAGGVGLDSSLGSDMNHLISPFPGSVLTTDPDEDFYFISFHWGENT